MIWTIDPTPPWRVTASDWKSSGSATDNPSDSRQSATFLKFFEPADRPTVEVALIDAVRRGTSGCPCQRLTRRGGPGTADGYLELTAIARVGADQDTPDQERAGQDRADRDEPAAPLAIVARWTATAGVTASAAAATASDGDAHVINDLGMRQFLGAISHDLRAPLNGVLGMSRLLLDSGVRPDQLDYARAIDASAEQLLSVIEDLLEFATLHTKTDLLPVDVDPRALVHEVIASLTSHAAERELEVCALIAAQVPERIRVDSGRLRQVLTYIVEDGLARMAVGDVIIRVTPEGEASDGESELRLRFDVSVDEPSWTDTPRSAAGAAGATGTAFDMNDPNASPRAAVCRHLVALMGGSFGTDVDVQGGTTHWFTVRVTPRPAPAAEKPRDLSLAGHRVLCVEDQPVSRRVLLEQMRGWDLTVEATDEAHSALTLMKVAAAAGAPFDLVIIDLRLPGVDGLSLTRLIKAEAALASTKLVLLTAYPARGQAVAAYEAGVDAYLQKPIREAPLRACLEALLNDTQASCLVPVGSERRYDTDTSWLRPRVLVADDHPLNQKVAVQLLEKLGCRVDVVSDGADAVDAIRQTPYHLVLMEGRLPSLDGADATRAIRRLPAHTALPPIIALTGGDDDETRASTLAAGANDIMPKPLRLNLLREKLAQWIDATPPPR